jgi:hypothetical protein
MCWRAAGLAALFLAGDREVRTGRNAVARPACAKRNAAMHHWPLHHPDKSPDIGCPGSSAPSRPGNLEPKPMTAHPQAQAADPSERPAAPARAMDPVDAMLRGRYAQQPLMQWLRDRIRGVPK